MISTRVRVGLILASLCKAAITTAVSAAADATAPTNTVAPSVATAPAPAGMPDRRPEWMKTPEFEARRKAVQDAEKALLAAQQNVPELAALEVEIKPLREKLTELERKRCDLLQQNRDKLTAEIQAVEKARREMQEWMMKSAPRGTMPPRVLGPQSGGAAAPAPALPPTAP